MQKTKHYEKLKSAFILTTTLTPTHLSKIKVKTEKNVRLIYDFLPRNEFTTWEMINKAFR